MEQEKKRVIYLDVLKIIACFFVIVNHTQSSTFREIQSPNIYFLSVFYFFLSKISVPIFVMTTGALLIKKDISLKTLFKKYILKIIFVIIIFSYLFFIIQNKSFDIFIFFKTIIFEPIDSSYWYLYMLVGLYLMSPFIKNMINGLSKSLYLLLFVLWIVFVGTIPVLRFGYGITILMYLDIQILSGYIGYYIFGDYINRNELKLPNYLKIILSLVLLFCSTLLVTFLSINQSKKSPELLFFLDNVTFIFFIVSSLSLFVFIKTVFSKITLPNILEKIISHISRCTFGIYLIHTILIKILINTKIYLISNIGNLTGIILFQILVFMLSFAVVNVLIKLPIIKKLI